MKISFSNIEEQERNSFFDSEQTVYDVDIGHEFKKKNYEKAFNYAETSSSRSLLDWLKRSDRVSINKDGTEILFEDSSKPLNLKEIQKRMPENIQILQYSVLNRSILIWLVSQNNLIVKEVKTDTAELKKRVDEYLKLIQSESESDIRKTKEMSRSFFDLLVKPVLADLDKEKEVGIVPNKFLFNLPFASLTFPDGEFSSQNLLSFIRQVPMF